jgi:ferredoxin
MNIFASVKNHYHSQKIQAMAYKISEDCTACGTCIDECPVDAISEGDIYKIDPDVCTDCGACADVCPVEAIHPE